ncbi:hypothetical protein F511_25282 [Dorcoceras hygrometricum]|uniref:Uncharacterized protein n=1 Tax=Dorcoceras hygrometricum TaxID=472368 RepID=A0A2Z7AHH2_9LAMI|nr:hypothetical protein F511_25282 [Dorcoceras hygrometricum]
MGTGIDQLNLRSVQLGYLKILQVGNTDPNNTKAGKQIRGQASISPGTANLKPSLTGHGNSAVAELSYSGLLLCVCYRAVIAYYCSVLIIDAVIEDERQYRSPHLPAGYQGFSAGRGDDSAGGASRGG